MLRFLVRFIRLVAGYHGKVTARAWGHKVAPRLYQGSVREH